MRTLRKCAGGCGQYLMTVQQNADDPEWKERIQYCKECWEKRLGKPISLEDLEKENPDLQQQIRDERSYRAEQAYRERYSRKDDQNN